MDMHSWGSMKVSMILLILIFLSSSADAQGDLNHYRCTSNGNYTRNSTYSANLNTLLQSLSSNMSDNGYYTSSVGKTPNTVNAFALCRADQTLRQCRSCVVSATEMVLQVCPNYRQAVIWFDYCTLRFSNDPIHQTRTSELPFLMSNLQVVFDGDWIMVERVRLLDDLMAQAANGSYVLKVGVGTSKGNSSDPTLFGLVQCTPDLSSEACMLCLNQISRHVKDNVVWLGARVLAPECNIRYEVYPLYNETRLRELSVLPLQDINDNTTITTTGNNTTSTINTTTTNNNTRLGKKDCNTTKVLIIIVVVFGVTLTFAACAIIFMIKRMKRMAYRITETAEDISTVKCQQYDFSKIRAATGDFDNANKLGEGGFGTVYKGRLETGEEIAVKRLSRDSGQGNMEFKNEVLLVAKLQHRNLVKLLGFSMEGRERVLVYEFVQNASLDQFIFDRIKRSLLDWDKRYKIIGGIAKGIMYLHEDSRLKIIHRDLKASNVLLDGDMNPKIADFGMARLFKPDETQANTSKIVGTYGYMSPEYAMHGQFSIKSDVFSFGVLVLEILSGQRNVCIQNEEHVEDLLTSTWKKWRDGTAAMMIDPTLRNDEGSVLDMLRCIHMGLLCVQESPANRPTMALVVLMLNSSTMILPAPSEPAFYMASCFGPTNSTFRQYESNSAEALKSKTSASESSTNNNLSITDLYPR